MQTALKAADRRDLLPADSAAPAAADRAADLRGGSRPLRGAGKALDGAGLVPRLHPLERR